MGESSSENLRPVEARNVQGFLTCYSVLGEWISRVRLERPDATVSVSTQIEQRSGKRFGMLEGFVDSLPSVSLNKSANANRQFIRSS